VRHNTIIYKYLRPYTTILVLMQIYFVRGDMFRLIIQPSSGQLTMICLYACMVKNTI